MVNTRRVYLSIRSGGGFENEGESVVRTDLGTGERRVLASFPLMIERVTERGDAVLVNLRDGGMGLRSFVVLTRAGVSTYQARGQSVTGYPSPTKVTISTYTVDGSRVKSTRTVMVSDLLKRRG